MLQYKDIVIRPIGEADLPEIVALGNDVEHLGGYLPCRMRSLEAYREDFKERKGFMQPENSWFAITARDGRLLGNIGFFKPVFYMAGLEIGASIFREEDRGRGLMTQAAQVFAPYVFAVAPIPSLRATAASGNVASRRVIEKCGFSLDGIERAATFAWGKVQDLAVYSLLRGECPTLEEVLAAARAPKEHPHP